MKLEDILEDVITITSCVTFIYNGKNCGIDPYSQNNFAMWYGDEDFNATSIDDVITVKLFDGKSLAQLADEIKWISG